MNRLLRSALAFTIFVLWVPAQAQTSFVIKQSILAQQQGVSYRKHLLDNLLLSMRLVTNKIHDKSATNIYTAFSEGGALVIPVLPGVLALPDQSRYTPHFFLTIRQPNDLVISQSWGESFNAGWYDTTTYLIQLADPAEFTPVWYAIFSLHQGKIAVVTIMHDQRGIASDPSPLQYVSALEFQGTVTAEYGGSIYAQCLTREIEYLRKTSDFHYHPGLYDFQLDQIAGKPKSSEEKDYRMRSLWVDSVFHFIDSDFTGTKEEKESCKARFIMTSFQ